MVREHKEVLAMIGPHNEQSNQRADNEDEATFAWDEASVLI